MGIFIFFLEIIIRVSIDIGNSIQNIITPNLLVIENPVKKK